MAKAWLVNSRGIAKKVKNATTFSVSQVKDLGPGAIRECPNCKHCIDNSDVSHEWPGLPAGVKFDPSDIELVEHLAGKIGHGNSKPHVLIDEFIPTLEEDEGICYTHPKNLPGVKQDGSSAHFFHRTLNAYATGHRKRRKILKGHNLSENIRWHKTGKTRPVIENGVQKGFKKILVLYKSSKKGLKPVKTSWVMHQYHLGSEEDEEGEFVVSKVFFQLQSNQGEKSEMDPIDVDFEVLMAGVSPRTPKTHTPHPPRAGENCQYGEGDEDNIELLPREDKGLEGPRVHVFDTNVGNSSSVLAGESQVVEERDPEDMVVSLMCDEVLDPLFSGDKLGLKHGQCSGTDFDKNDMPGKENVSCGFPDLDSIDTDTPPDFNLADLQFGSQDSFMSWIDWL